MQRISATYARNLAAAPASVMALAVAALLSGCPPPEKANSAAPGEFIAESNKFLDFGDNFDIRDKVVYPETQTEGLSNPTTFVTDRKLTELRCTWCHECGFERAFDLERYGTAYWQPLYRGEMWKPIVQRMQRVENNMLNEVLAERIFNFLRDSTTGKYDESKDTHGGAIREAPPGPAQPGASTAKPGAATATPK